MIDPTNTPTGDSGRIKGRNYQLDPPDQETLAAAEWIRSGSKGPPPKTRKNGQKKSFSFRKPRKPTLKYYRVTHVFWQKLAIERATPDVWALVGALFAAWYASGYYDEHLNPFPLNSVTVKIWELTRSQKSRALQWLIQKEFIQVDRSDPKNPLVTLAWIWELESPPT